VVVENFQFIDSKGGGGSGGERGGRTAQPAAQAHAEVAESDIPF
jgi:hypothetical protein